MDKYEYKIRVEEIKQMINQQNYAKAAEIADTIDWRRVKSVMMLCTISDVYKANRRYTDARDILLLAYDRRPGGRAICYSLCELSIKTEEFIQAVEFYKEFVQVAPKDAGRYILQYKLYEAQDVSLEERIEVLEEFKKRDYREKWAYELAYLYHRVGLATRCVEECDELILWFGEGKYVYKAMELKMLHQPLSPKQQEMYDARFNPKEETLEENVSSLEESQAYNQEQEQKPAEVTQDTKVYGQKILEDDSLGDTRIYNPKDVLSALENKSDAIKAEDIVIKPVDVGQFNTVNLQAEIAQGLKEVLGEEEIGNKVEDSQTENFESDTESLDMPELDEELSEDDFDNGLETIEDSEVFFGETGEINVPENSKLSQKESDDSQVDNTASIVMNQIKQGEAIDEYKSQADEDADNSINNKSNNEIVREDKLPEGMAEVLSQDLDGQISMVVPENRNMVDKQITGQLNLDEVLFEWERMKRENERKREEQVRQHVLEQTGSMFTEFEASVRDGLLEKIQAENGIPVDYDNLVSQSLKGEANAADALINPEKQDEFGEVEELSEIENSDEDANFADYEAEDGQEEAEDFDEFEEEPEEEFEEENQNIEESEELGQESVEEAEVAAEAENNYEVAEEEAKAAEAENNYEAVEEEAKATEAENNYEAVEEEAEIATEAENNYETVEEEAEIATEAENNYEAVEEEAKIATEAENNYEAVEEEAKATEAENNYEAVEEISAESEPGVNFGAVADIESQIEPELEPGIDANFEDGVIAEAEVENSLEAEAETVNTLPNNQSISENLEEILSERDLPLNENKEEDDKANNEADKEDGSEGFDLHRRTLSRDERELFAPFVQNKKARDQLISIIDGMSLAPYTGNVIITGEEGIDTMSLAKNLIREVQVSDSNFSGKVAKISGGALNKKSVDSIITDLNNGALIIEKASEMENHTANVLYKALQQETRGVIVVLIDTKKAMNSLISMNSCLEEPFNMRMDVEALSNDALASFGKQYAYKKEFAIDEMGILALHTRIEELQTSDHVANIVDVKKIVDEAISHASKKTVGHFFDILLSKRYDDEDMIVLSEKDFS